MRRLSETQASACERATTPRCRCRCGGAFHGACRTADVTQLPDTDPHSPDCTADGRPLQPSLFDLQEVS